MSHSAVQCTYIVTATIADLAVLAFSAIAPLYGVHWGWSAFGVFLLIVGSVGFTKRVNSWGTLGKLE